MGRFTSTRSKQNSIQKEIVEKLLRSNDLLKYIGYPLSPNPLLEQDVENPIDIINKLIFTTPKDTEVVVNESVVLIVRTLMKPCSGNSNFRNIMIMFDIITNVNCINNISNGDNRSYCIADIIDDIIYDSRGSSWIGKVEYKGDYDGAINKSHTKLQLLYEVVSFS